MSMPPTANLNFPLVLERTVKTTTDAAVGCDMEEDGRSQGYGNEEM